MNTDLYRRRYPCLLCPARARVKGRPGKAWLRQVSPEDRRIFSELGRMEQRRRYDNWHRDGARARIAKYGRCEQCGKLLGKAQHQCKAGGTTPPPPQGDF